MLFITVLKVLIKTNHHKNGEDVNAHENERQIKMEREKERKRKRATKTEERNKMLVQ